MFKNPKIINLFHNNDNKMWVYIGIGACVSLIVCLVGYIAYRVVMSMGQKLSGYLESKKEVRLHPDDINLNVKMHRGKNLKKLMKDLGVDDFKRAKTKDN